MQNVIFKATVQGLTLRQKQHTPAKMYLIDHFYKSVF